jgi:hypothetical protein
MAKPSDTMQWATDVGATNDPGVTRRATGFVAGKKAPAKWFNYLHNAAGKWFAYLNNLHAEADFLNQAYTWSAKHTFSAATDVAGALTLTGPSNDLAYATPRSRTALLNLTGGAHYTGTWNFGTSKWQGSTNSSTLAFSLSLPGGATITRVRAGVQQGATPASGCSIALLEITPNKGAVPAASTRDTLGGDAATAAGFARLEITPSPIPSTNNILRWHELVFQTSNVATTTPDELHWLEIQFTDPGPRNY